MEEIMNKSKDVYKNAKWVILLYPPKSHVNIKRYSTDDTPLMDEDIMETLEEMGYIVLNAEDLTDKPIRNLEYRSIDGDHPNEKAWDAVVPALIKELGIK